MLDPGHERILVVPSDEVPTQTVVTVMDAVRADETGPLFPQVALGGTL